MNPCKALLFRVPFEKRGGKKLFSIASFLSTSNSSKPKVVIIGAGWAGYRVGLDIDKNKYDVHLISPRNHFLFTPLLPSTAVGTLEFRAIQEPVRTIPNMNYIQAQVESINFDSKVLKCSDIFTPNREFSINYDTLVLAPGAETNTLNVPGVTNNENVFFLKQLSHSRAIRNRLLDCFERASSPLVESNAEKRNLLNFMIVGGGPTSVEFAAELYDFLKEDVAKWYPDLLPFTKVRIVEASGHILGSFNSSLVGYVESLFKKRNIELLTGTVVKEVKENCAILSDGSRLPFGLMVWSTGIKQVPLIQNIPADLVSKFPNGRLKVDSHLRLLQQGKDLPIGDGSVFAIGDCAGDSVKPLPPLAQVAAQQGKYVADSMNVISSSESKQPFLYQHLGSMASVGQWRGVFDSPGGENTQDGNKVKGVLAFFLWRAAYWTKQVSIVNKILIPMYWFKAMIFGRDISRF